MGYEFWLGLRYLRAKRKQAAISIVTFLSILGVGVGVTALIVVISVINGFNEDLKEKILGLTAHVMLFQRGQEMKGYEELRKDLLEFSGVSGATPFVIREVILQSPARSVQAVIRAVDPATADSVIPLTQILKQGALSQLIPPPPGSPPGILLGRGLLKELGSQIGDTVMLISPEGTLTPWGNLPKWKKFQVKGYFDAGYWDFDSKVAIVSIPVAQEVFEIPGRVTGMEIRVPDVYRAPEVRQRLQQSPIGAKYIAQDWTQLNRNLMMALAMQKKVIFVILFCIVAVAALLIISILVMMVIEKQKDIAILKAMGAGIFPILRVFVFQGLAIGAVGTFLGCAGGLLVSWNLEWIIAVVERTFHVQFLPEDVYFIGHLTSRANPLDVAVITGTTLLISFLASLYPAWRASRLDPIEGLRYE
jgi:lipoprotein-releasing system permease protein